MGMKGGGVRKTGRIRTRKLRKAGKRRKRKLVVEGSTPPFPVHPEKGGQAPA